MQGPGQQKHTLVASMAIGLADQFKLMLSKHRIEGPVTYLPELSAPDGPSTAGGKQALQHMKLVPVGGGATIVFGSAHTVDKRAELRTFDHVAEVHRQRFKGAELPIDRVRYEALAEAAQTFLTLQGFQVTTVELPATPGPTGTHARASAPGRAARLEPAGGWSPAKTGAVIAGATAAAVAAWFFLAG